MSEVICKGCKALGTACGECSRCYSEAQSELAALREALAERNKHPDWVQVEIHKNGIEERDADIEQLHHRLTAAEQRNAELVELLKLAYGAIDENNGWKKLCARILAALKPTESGETE